MYFVDKVCKLSLNLSCPHVAFVKFSFGYFTALFRPWFYMSSIFGSSYYFSFGHLFVTVINLSHQKAFS